MIKKRREKKGGETLEKFFWLIRAQKKETLITLLFLAEIDCFFPAWWLSPTKLN
jgi:hypothetical protein